MVATVESVYGGMLYVNVFKDDDFAEDGWAYWISRRKDGDEVVDAGHTYDDNYADSLEYVCNLAERL